MASWTRGTRSCSRPCCRRRPGRCGRDRARNFSPQIRPWIIYHMFRPWIMSASSGIDCGRLIGSCCVCVCVVFRAWQDWGRLLTFFKEEQGYIKTIFRWYALQGNAAPCNSQRDATQRNANQQHTIDTSNVNARPMWMCVQCGCATNVDARPMWMRIQCGWIQSMQHQRSTPHV